MTPSSCPQHTASTVPLRRTALRIISLLTIFALLLPASAFALPIDPVQLDAPNLPAATLTVLNVNDSGAGSLRQAVLDANLGDTIVFTPTLAGQTIVLTSGAIVIDKPLGIDGAAAPGVRISGNDASRVFNVSIGPVALNNLILEHGYIDGSGGAVYAAGAIVFANSAILSSTAEASGGGLYAAGAAALINVDLINNTAHGDWRSNGDAGGGAYFGDVVTVSGGRIANNRATSGVGGGAYADGSLVVTATQFISNSAAYAGGGAHVIAAAVLADAWFERNQSNGGGGGGGLRAGEATIANTVFLSNTTPRDGGGALIVGLPNSSGDATVVGGRFEGNQCTNVEWCRGGGLYVRNTLVSVDADYINNSASGAGGGAMASDAYLTGGSFDSNTARDGGGIYVELPLTLHVTDTQFLHNTAFFNGGGAYATGDVILHGGSFQDNTAAGSGGGVYANWGTLTLSGTHFLLNYAGMDGGGIYAAGAAEVHDGLFQTNSANGTGGGFFVGNSFVISNTRFIANLALGEGSGMFRGSGQRLVRPRPDVPQPGDASRIVNSLFARNSGSVQGGSIIGFDGQSPLEILYTTIAHPTFNAAAGIRVYNGAVTITDTIITSYTIGIDNVGGVVAEDYNLLFGNGAPVQGTVTSGGNGQTGAPNFLNPGVDDYHLGISSNAIDNAIDAGIYDDLDYVVRPQGSGFDIGAYERIPVTLSASNDSPTVLGVPTNLTATLQGSVSPAPLFTWDFGDGSPTTAGVTVPHTYPAVGVYLATVIADNGVISLTATTPVTITDQPILNLTAINDSPTALGRTTALTATAAGSNITYTWDLGDGAAGAIGAVQNHVYPALGTYTAVVTATNSVSTAVATTIVTITDASILNLAAINDSPTVLGRTTHLTATATGGSIVYTWGFGDGAAGAIGATQNHIYPAVGVYTAFVTATNGISTAVASTLVTITEPPVYRVYLPIILNNFFTAPELVVENVIASADVITVVIKNVGDAPAVDDFWVDAYIAPNPPPVAVNEIWWDQNRSQQGVVWGVTGALMPLVPGQTITLTSLDAYVSPVRTFFTGSLPIGTPVYAQVDSYNAATLYGAVLERSEIMNEPYNNIFGPVLSQATLGWVPAIGRATAVERNTGTLPLRVARPE